MAIINKENVVENFIEPGEDELIEEYESESNEEEASPPRFVYYVYIKYICSGCETFDDFKHTFSYYAELMQKFKDEETIEIEGDGCHVTFFTYNAETAERFGFEPELNWE